MPLPPNDELRNAIQAADATWQMGLSLITGMTDQARKTLLGVEIDRDALDALIANRDVSAAAPPSPPPPEFDWRNHNGQNFITPVKFQRECGACVSFASCAIVESMNLIAGGETLDLSEADLQFFGSHPADCSGWFPSTAMADLTTRGVADDAAMPYVVKVVNGFAEPVLGPMAPDRDKRAVKITKASPALMTMAERKSWIASHGPVAGIIQAYGDFYLYKSGIYQHVTGDSLGYHCIAIIGYSDADQCWIAKNSWDTTWGENGFFRIRYGECGIDETSADTDPVTHRVNNFPMLGAEGVILPPEAPSPWSGWKVRGGGIAVAPAVASMSPTSLDVFARGIDNQLWQLHFENNTWGSWQSLGGNIDSAPAAVSRGPGQLDVFARDSDGKLWWWYFEHGTWSAPTNIATGVLGDPAVSPWGPDRLDVFSRGDANQLLRLWFDGEWHGFDQLGGQLTSAPAAVCSELGKIDVFARGIDNTLQHIAFANGAWGAWQSLAGGLNTAPAAASWGPNHLDVFAGGFEGHLWHRAFDGAWRGWEDLGGSITTAPAAVSKAVSQIDVFVRGTDNQVLQKSFALSPV